MLPPWPLTQILLAHPQPREEIPPPPHPCPLAKSNSQFLPSIFFFLLVSARLDEQSPLLCLPSLTYILIRSCGYPAVICLVSTFTQTRLANRCVLQLHSLRRAHLRALTGLLGAWLAPGAGCCLPPISSSRLTSGPGWGGQAARTHLLSLSNGISSQWFPGFSHRCRGVCVDGWGSGKSKPMGGTVKKVQKERMKLPAQRCSPLL